ncbi:hypothetical protein BC827DRAFT_563329 [Russula dissimulans]|nr:hypothetical protein BC827DRAFT_563329 [Russula dissimulans]
MKPSTQQVIQHPASSVHFNHRGLQECNCPARGKKRLGSWRRGSIASLTSFARAGFDARLVFVALMREIVDLPCGTCNSKGSPPAPRHPRQRACKLEVTFLLHQELCFVPCTSCGLAGLHFLKSFDADDRSASSNLFPHSRLRPRSYALLPRHVCSRGGR